MPLGFDKWSVLGHSFGGQVALEHALHSPDRLSHLLLLDTGGEGRLRGWSVMDRLGEIMVPTLVMAGADRASGRASRPGAGRR